MHAFSSRARFSKWMFLASFCLSSGLFSKWMFLASFCLSSGLFYNWMFLASFCFYSGLFTKWMFLASFCLSSGLFSNWMFLASFCFSFPDYSKNECFWLAFASLFGTILKIDVSGQLLPLFGTIYQIMFWHREG